MKRDRASVAMGRRFGSSPEALQRMRAHDAACIWVGQCRKCGESLKGTIESLLEHKCEEADGP